MNTQRYPSEHWFKDIETLFYNVLKYFKSKKGGSHLAIKENDLKNIKTDYYNSMTFFKNEIYKDKIKDSKIDRHKIIAIYIKSILKNKPFYFESLEDYETNKIAWFVPVANEFFAIALIATILKGWHNDKTHKLAIPDNYRKCLIILFHHYLNNINTLDIVSLSHIIYFIEANFYIKMQS